MTESKKQRGIKGLRAMSLALGIGATLTTLTTDADATVFSGSFVVNVNTSEPGLVINTLALGDGSFTTPDISEGGAYTFNLFQIWTDEPSVKTGDEVAKPISVQFTFTGPSAFGGTVDGATRGSKLYTGFVAPGILHHYHEGWVYWSNLVTLSYPGGGDGALTLTLSGESFNGGSYGLEEGPGRSAIVKATFTNIKDPTPAPEPATLTVLGLGLAGLGLLRRRKQVV
jgi:hypothetical protein